MTLACLLWATARLLALAATRIDELGNRRARKVVNSRHPWNQPR